MIDISIKDYTYQLPEDKIAFSPTKNRADSKLMVLKNGSINHHKFNQIKDYIPKGSTLFFNNTKVIPARLFFKNSTGAKIEIFLIKNIHEDTHSSTWEVIIGNRKKWKDKVIHQWNDDDIKAELINEKENIVTISWINYNCFDDLIQQIGKMPLPPYIKREDNKEDKIRYQTVYAEHKGSSAAPTAGLHFTDNIINDLSNNHIESSYLTLHVGLGTFMPVKTDKIIDHDMHREVFSIEKKMLINLLNSKKTIPVGTTSMRVIESLYYLGVLIDTNKRVPENIPQWFAYEYDNSISPKNAIEIIINFMKINDLEQIHSSTSIIIVPGYQFKYCQGLITNFHQPNSTLLLLVAALVGQQWKNIYQSALDNNYRFLSYGDSSLLLP